MNEGMKISYQQSPKIQRLHGCGHICLYVNKKLSEKNKPFCDNKYRSTYTTCLEFSELSDAASSPMTAPQNIYILLVSRMCTKFYNRGFNASRPWLWNNLPSDMTQLDLSHSQFRQWLKRF